MSRGEFPRLLLWLFRIGLFRGSDAALGDLLEEHSSGKHSPSWLWRQALSTMLPGRRRAQLGSLREDRKAGMWTGIWSDLRYGARGLRLNPTFTMAAVLAIALGIGVNTAIFTVLNGVALRPPPAPEAHQLVNIHQGIMGIGRNAHGSDSMFSTSEYGIYRDNTQTLSGLAAFRPFVEATLGSDTPVRVFGEMVSCNYFDTIGRLPDRGPGFQDSDCELGAPPTVVLSHQSWANRFAANPAILGQTIVLNRQNFRVVGIAPEGFHGIEFVKSEFWAPIGMQPILDPGDDFYNRTDVSWLALFGRRKAGIELDQVRAELAVIAAQIDQQQPGRETAINARQATFLAFPDARAPLFSIAAIVMVGFGLVLLIACANVANLLLARAAGRTKEIAVRLSVGATRGRLLRQLLTESLLIAMAGGAIGAALAAEASQTLVDFALRSLPAEIPFNVDTSPDLRVLGFAFGITCLTGIAFGLMPALQASKPDLQSALKQDDAVCGRSTVGWLRGGLVTVQVAVCMTLMVAAGLLMRGLYAAQTVEPGFNYHDIALVSMDLEGSGYSVPDGGMFHERLMDEIRPLPGIEAVAQASVTPLGQNRRGTVVWPEGQENAQRVYMNEVSPGYLQVLEIPIVRGRDFTPAEVTDSPSSVIVTQSTSRRFWPGEDPLTKTMEIGVGRSERRVLQVVGVAADTQVLQIGEDDTSFIYLPAGPQMQLRSMILARTTADFAAVAAAIRKKAEEMDSGLVVNVNRLEENLEIWRSLSRLAAVLSGSMGALALLLASIGVYGVVAYAVSRRLREVGIRMALGASGRDVMSMLLRQAMTPVLVGTVIGVLACAAVSRILSSALFGVSPLDPIVFVVAPACLIAVAVLASVIPARLVMRVDPVNTLRYE